MRNNTIVTQPVPLVLTMTGASTLITLDATLSSSLTPAVGRPGLSWLGFMAVDAINTAAGKQRTQQVNYWTMVVVVVVVVVVLVVVVVVVVVALVVAVAVVIE